ncbi:hypothetical protein TRIUR3_24437 [Triticum urartu]|uniref:Uncharacterized protein n=1 Tax=Triticum urartu TaxID=4572 RepID=M7ZES7_TRIUA|nr:hypothetical protein TRIUR3_24437 [Triticum urartu]
MAGWCLVRGETGSSFVLDAMHHACCGAATQMGRALDNGLVRNNLFTQWVAKAGTAAKACGKASAKEKGGDAPGKGNGEAGAGKASAKEKGGCNALDAAIAPTCRGTT